MRYPPGLLRSLLGCAVVALSLAGSPAHSASTIKHALLSTSDAPCTPEPGLTRMQAYLDLWLYGALHHLDRRRIASYRTRLSEHATDGEDESALRERLRLAQVYLRTDERQLDRARSRLQELTGLALLAPPPAPPDPRGYLPITLGAARQGHQAQACHTRTHDTQTEPLPLDSSWHQYQALSQRLEQLEQDATAAAGDDTQRRTLLLRRNRLEHAVRILLLTGRLSAYVHDIGQVAEAWPAQISRVAPPANLPQLPRREGR